MNKLYIFFALTLLLFVKGQVAINAANPANSAVLDITSTNKGILLPQYELVSLTNAVSPVNNPAKGSMIYNTGKGTSVYPKGYYYWTGTAWERMLANSEIDQILRVQVYGGGDASSQPLVVPNGTGTNIVSFQNTGIVNTIQGVSFSGGQNITLPAGTYRIDITFDSNKHSDSSTVSNFLSPYGLYVINSGIVDASNVLLTDLKTISEVSDTRFSIQSYKFTHILKLSESKTVRLMLNHGNGYSESGGTYPSQSGLVVTFYKMNEA